MTNPYRALCAFAELLMPLPRDRDPDWRRSFNHENTNRPSGPPPLLMLKSPTVTVQGLNWPATLGDFTLVGPADNQGAWRWYERNHNGTTERVKVDHQLQPLGPISVGYQPRSQGSQTNPPLLDQPDPEGPTDEDLEDLADVMNVSGNPVPAMRRALELWGRPTPQPVAEGPTDEELLKLIPQALDDSLSGAARAMFQNSLSSASDVYKALIKQELHFARAVLAKWGH